MIVSLLLHIALLLPWYLERAPQCCTTPPAVSLLDVQLLDTSARPTPSTAPQAHAHVRHASTTDTSANVAVVDTRAGTRANADTPDVLAGAPAGAMQQLARRLLIAELARYFSYPTLARRHGWEGQVLLSLTIEADGHLQNLRLAHSSGHAVLDSAALQALRRVVRLSNAHERLGGNAVDVRLPVIYQLQE